VEFADNDGKFVLNEYGDQHNFEVMGSLAPTGFNFRTPTPSSSSQMPSSSSTQQSSRRSVTAPLATVKVVRADIGDNGKPSNLLLHNLHVHINIYHDVDACISYVQEKVRDEMNNNTLCLVGTSGFLYQDNDGTRGMVYMIKSNNYFIYKKFVYMQCLA